jgi:hypothetical protein
VLPLGLAPSSLPDFITALTANDKNALQSIPHVTPQIIQAGVGGLLNAYLSSFRYVWVTAAAFALAAAIGSLNFVEKHIR